MIKFKGTTIFPQTIFDVFDVIEEVICYKIIVSKDDFHNDKITILLQKELIESHVYKLILEKCQSRLKVIPIFTFHELEVIQSQVYKKNLRKPEKIVFI
jgi:phenylacetate-CoA ligase